MSAKPERRLGCLARRLALAAALLPVLAPAYGQADSLARQLTRYGQRLPAEKLFVHLDRPSYVSGETLWFKIYAADGRSHRPQAAGTVAYVEVLDAASQPVRQVKVALRQASGHGSLQLPETLASGRYTLRAYTRWMQNFAPELYFHASITVVNLQAAAGAPAPAAQGYDPQFFPEGGYLVQGLRSRVGFKLTDGAGRGVAAEGTVLDGAGRTVARFSTLRFGLGSFDFTPARAGGSYTARIRVAGQPAISCRLPAVREQGYVLRLEDAGPGQLRLSVQARGGAAEDLSLLGHARQQVAVAATAPLRGGQAEFLVDKRRLAPGITHFTLFNSRRQPLLERLYFRPPPPLALPAGTDRHRYAPRQKVTLTLPAGLPAPASLSVAVYQVDSLAAGAHPDISAYLWLTSDLRGLVESPGYYCTATGPEGAAAADNLMLTQGWSRFSWDEVLAGQHLAPAYAPELSGHLLGARVLNAATGAPQAGVPVYLTALGRPGQLRTAASKADGSVQFELPGFFGTRQLVLQPNLRRDSLCRVELLSPFSPRFAAGGPGAWALSEALLPALQRRHVQAEVQRRFPGPASAAYAVPRPDSTAFYGRADERYRLDDYTRFKVMEEVMREYVTGVQVRTRKDGFHFLVPDHNTSTLMENPLVLLDGLPVFDTNRIMAFDPLKVRQLDVVTSRYFLGPLLHNGLVSYTTYGGDLGGFVPDARALLLEYEGLQGRREFYAPRYDTPAATQSRHPDFRNLLYWHPDLRLSPGRGATLDFFTSDQTGTYQVVIQGLADNGLSGSSSFRIEVKAAL